MLRRLLAFLLMLIVMVSVSACTNNAEDDKKFYDYSVGLNEFGIYTTIENYMIELPNFEEVLFTYDEIIQYAIDTSSNGTDEKISIDDFVKTYGEEILTALELTNKDLVEDGDICNVSLVFKIDGKELEGYSSTSSYQADKDGDSIIKSMIGHKPKDVYDVEYTFPADSKEHASKTAMVTVKINNVYMNDPIGNGVVENNLEAIQKVFKDVTDSNSFLKTLKPHLAASSMMLYTEEYLQKMKDIDVPQEYIEYEYARFRCRIQEIGYKYSDYLKKANATHEDILEYCKEIARKNYICMQLFVKTNAEITEKEFAEYYGDTLEYIKSVQGEPYMYMKMVKEKMVLEIAKQIQLVESK